MTWFSTTGPFHLLQGEAFQNFVTTACGLTAEIGTITAEMQAPDLVTRCRACRRALYQLQKLGAV